MISSESWMLEIGMSSSMSGEKKRDYAREGTGDKRKRPANCYSLTLR